MSIDEKKLRKEIVARLKPVDVEASFDDCLDEIYSFKGVGGPFSCMSPSSVLKEVDPIQYRCGVAEHVDMMVSDGDITDEIDGKHYLTSAVKDLEEELEAEYEDSHDFDDKAEDE